MNDDKSIVIHGECGLQELLNNPAMVAGLAEILAMPICRVCDTPVKWCTCEPKN